MRHVNTLRVKGMFEPVMVSKDVQAAVMILKAGESSSDRLEDEHPRAEQWLYVVKGSGVARGKKGRGIRLKAGSLLLIGKNEAHQIVNTGEGRMVTVNFYAPPAYTKEGEVRRGVRGRGT